MPETRECQNVCRSVPGFRAPNCPKPGEYYTLCRYTNIHRVLGIYIYIYRVLPLDWNLFTYEVSVNFSYFILSAGFMFCITKNRNLSKGNTRHSAVSTLSKLSEGSCKGNTWKVSICQGLHSVLIINIFCWHCRSAMESLFLVGIRTKV